MENQCPEYHKTSEDQLKKTVYPKEVGKALEQAISQNRKPRWSMNMTRSLVTSEKE